MDKTQRQTTKPRVDDAVFQYLKGRNDVLEETIDSDNQHNDYNRGVQDGLSVQTRVKQELF